MTLLLAKRATKTLLVGQKIKLLISEQSSKADIESYLLKNSFKLECEEIGSDYCLKATKELC